MLENGTRRQFSQPILSAFERLDQGTAMQRSQMTRGPWQELQMGEIQWGRGLEVIDSRVIPIISALSFITGTVGAHVQALALDLHMETPTISINTRRAVPLGTTLLQDYLTV